MKIKACYGIDGPNAIKGLLLGAIALFLAGTLFNFFIAKFTFLNSIQYGFWWSSFCIASIVFMLLSSLFGKFVMCDKLINELELSGSERVLDVGCGRGLLLIAAAKKLKTGKAVGLDIWSKNDLSNNAIKNTLKNTDIEGVADKIELNTGDMTTMSFDDNSFDIIVSSMAIHNLPTKLLREKAIHEIHRVLKPGGHIALLDFMYTKEYMDSFIKLGWNEIQLSPRYFWQFPPVKVVSGKKPRGVK